MGSEVQKLTLKVARLRHVKRLETDSVAPADSADEVLSRCAWARQMRLAQKMVDAADIERDRRQMRLAKAFYNIFLPFPKKFARWVRHCRRSHLLATSSGVLP